VGVSLPFVAFVTVVTLAPIAAGLPIVVGRRVGDRVLHSLLGLAAGLMLGVAFLRILPRVFGEGGSGPALTLGVGFVALYVFEGVAGVHGHTAHEHEGGHEPGDHFASLGQRPTPALVALGLHMFLDGLILAPAFAVDAALGVATAAAVAAHKIPGGLATGTILAHTDLAQGPRALGVVAVALTTAVGALVGWLLVDVAGLVPHLLALAAATLMFVAVAELLPELHHGPHENHVVGGLVVGFGAIGALGVGLGYVGV
jgi:zinc and cadmium transporter